MRHPGSTGCRGRLNICGRWIWRRAGSSLIGRSTPPRGTRGAHRGGHAVSGHGPRSGRFRHPWAGGGTRARAGRYGRSARAYGECTPHRGRSALRRRPGHGAQGRAHGECDPRGACTPARRQLAALPGFLLIAGRYEGIDERVMTLGVDEDLSIGDYVLSGGELAALVVLDAVARLLPGVLGDERSSAE